MIRNVTHISQLQHDLNRIFTPVADDLVKTGFRLSDLEAASAGAFNPDYRYMPYDQNQHNHMNTVSIQMLGRRLKVVDLPRCVAELQHCLAHADAP